MEATFLPQLFVTYFSSLLGCHTKKRYFGLENHKVLVRYWFIALTGEHVSQ